MARKDRPRPRRLFVHRSESERGRDGPQLLDELKQRLPAVIPSFVQAAKLPSNRFSDDHAEGG